MMGVPGDLAERYRRAPTDPVALGELRDLLLPLTIKNALRTPFYEEVWSRRDVKHIDRRTLAELPVVDRTMIHSAGRRAQVRSGVICSEGLTKGTSGFPLVIARSDREQRFLHDFFARQAAQRTGPRRRCLMFKDLFHGNHVQIPTATYWHRVGVYDKGGFEYAREVLRRTDHDDLEVEEHCSLLLGGGPCLRAFTWDTYSRVGSRGGYHLEQICTVGEYVTLHWRYLMERTWHARVHDRFSLCEVFGGASEDPCSGWWHFDPCVVPEVVDVNSLQPIHEGIGVLVVTALFPFQQAQPLVRYATGDLVQATHSLPHCRGELAMRPLGRASDSVFMPGTGRCAITQASILETLDMLEVRRRPALRDSEQVLDPFVPGLPDYSLTRTVCEGKSVHVVLSVTANREARDGDADLRSSVICGLCMQNDGLEDLLRAGDIDIDVQLSLETGGADSRA
jgi:hypothetical protein